MAKKSLPRRQPATGKKAQSIRQPDLWNALGALSDATTFLEVAVKSLDSDDGAGGPELHVLEYALTVLRTVYNQFDRAITRLEVAHA